MENKKYLIVNLHLLSVYGFDNGSFQKARQRQLEQVLGFLESNPADVILVLGDFNFNPSSPSYDLMIKSGYKDVFTDKSENTISSSNSNRQKPWIVKMDERIDFIFLKGSFTIKERNRVFQDRVEVDGKNFHISDHYGLMVELV